MKKVCFKPAYTAPLVVVLLILSFWSGDALHNRVWNPLTAGTKQLDLSSLNDLYSTMQTRFDGSIDAQKALDGAKAGLIAAGGDPYTVYMTKDEAKSLNDQLAGKLSGVGAEVGIKNNLLTVIAPIAGAPAQKAGVRAGDVIAKIDGQDTTGVSLDVAVGKIRGKAGTQVKLTIVRPNSDPLVIVITRADITVPSVTWSLKNGDIGYINITTFGTDTSAKMDQAASELKAQGAKKIILDLRNDGGGYLSAGIDVASEFLPQGKLVVEERKNGKSGEKDYATGTSKLLGLPTIVLINGGSASASEIVSGALHDNGVAKLLGEQSFGKGSVQEIQNLAGGAELKITVAHWFTPGGVNINQKGLTPDTVVKLTNDDYNASRDPQLDAALAALK